MGIVTPVANASIAEKRLRVFEQHECDSSVGEKSISGVATAVVSHRASDIVVQPCSHIDTRAMGHPIEPRRMSSVAIELQQWSVHRKVGVVGKHRSLEVPQWNGHVRECESGPSTRRSVAYEAVHGVGNVETAR